MGLGGSCCGLGVQEVYEVGCFQAFFLRGVGSKVFIMLSD